MPTVDANRYPIGPFRPRPGLTDDEHRALIEEFAGFPANLRAAVTPLTEAQLDTPYQLYAWHGGHHLGHVRLVAGGD